MNRIAMAIALLTSGLLVAGCGSGPLASPFDGRKEMCASAQAWIHADATAREKALTGLLTGAIKKFEASADERARDVAIRAKALVTGDQQQLTAATEAIRSACR